MGNDDLPEAEPALSESPINDPQAAYDTSDTMLWHQQPKTSTSRINHR